MASDSEIDEECEKHADLYTALHERARAKLSDVQFDAFQNTSFRSKLTTIVAGAGAGKTRTCSYVVLKALIDPSVLSVSLLTSTKTAKCEAYDRCSRLYDDLGFTRDVVAPLSLRRVKTIHSVALTFAKEQNEEEGGAGVTVVGKSAIVDMIKEIIDDERDTVEQGGGVDNAASQTAVEAGTKDIVANLAVDDAAILLYNVRAERLKNNLPVADQNLGQTAYRVLKRLEAAMECDEKTGHALYDFDLMIAKFAAAHVPLVGKGSVLFVDEAQDLSLCMVLILLNTLIGEASVVVLGDDSQGIFQFSGALSNTIQELTKMASNHCINVEEFRLMQNHRSTEAIVQTSEALLPQVDRELRTDISGNGKHEYPVEAVLATSPAVVVARLLALLKTKTCEPGDIVVLRHKGFSWNEELVKLLATEASKCGMNVPVSVLGNDVAATVQMKAVVMIQMALGLEFFVDGPDEGIHIVRTFLRSVRGSRGAPANVVKVIENVWETLRCDPARLFTHNVGRLVDEFKRLEEAEANDETTTITKHPAKKQRTSTTGDSQKLRNFKETVRVAAAAIKQIRQRIEDVKHGRLPLKPMTVNEGGQQVLTSSSAAPKFAMSKEALPSIQHPLGALAFIVARDLVQHNFNDSESFAMQQLVDAYDGDMGTAEEEEEKEEGCDDDLGFVESTIVARTSKFVSLLNDKETVGKVVFSTIHRFKGKERPCAFVLDLKKPFHNPEPAKRATLSNTHDVGCTNLDGAGGCQCLGFKASLERAREAGIAEKLRLFYVAASRAKERLFLQFSDPEFDKVDAICPGARRTVGQWALCKVNPQRPIRG